MKHQPMYHQHQILQMNIEEWMLVYTQMIILFFTINVLIFTSVIQILRVLRMFPSCPPHIYYKHLDLPWNSTLHREQDITRQQLTNKINYPDYIPIEH